MNKIKNYLLFNPQYKHLSNNQLIYQYQKDKNDPHSKSIKSFEDFSKKYPSFDLNFYKNAYEELNNKNNIDLIQHWLCYGVYNNYISNKRDFYIKYPSFDFHFYNKHHDLNLLNEDSILFHYLTYGKYNHSIICEKNNTYINNQINDEQTDEQKIQQINQTNNCIFNKDISEPTPVKIAHLFVHFFKIGGGEVYFYELYNYFKKHKPSYQHTLFLNKNYQNNNDLKIDIPIIYYNDYDELYELLTDYTLILDNQVYFFKNITFHQKKTIHIIHGCDFYKKTLVHNQIYYSIHLYHETKNMNTSWTTTIKKINYLGVQQPTQNTNQTIIYNLNQLHTSFNHNIQNKMHVSIIGRIDPHKFPKTFLLNLIEYAPLCSFIFNIYGIIDKHYETYFLTTIKHVKNIIYHGFVEYKNIHTIYLKTHIVLSPSKSEAGATVVLEAMNHGCFVIAFNDGGNKETLQNDYFLANNCDDYFNILEKIANEDNNKKIRLIIQQKINILYNHELEHQCLKLTNYIEDIIQTHDPSQEIPNNVHYIYGLKKQTDPFPFLFYLGILSNVHINKPTLIYFHYHYLPYGYWWEKIKRYLTLNYIHHIDFKLKNGVSIEHYAHKSDYLRLLILDKYGGIYYDIDTLVIQSHHSLLKYACVIGIQEKFKNKEDIFGNAILFSRPNHFFIKDWLNKYENVFKNEEWTSASLFLPTEIYNKYTDQYKKDIHVVNQTYFYTPNYNEDYLLFQEKEISIDHNTTTFHYCQNYLHKYLDVYNTHAFEMLNKIYQKNQCSYNQSNQLTMFETYLSKIINYLNIPFTQCDHIYDSFLFNKIKDIICNPEMIPLKEKTIFLIEFEIHENVLTLFTHIDHIFFYNIDIYLIITEDEYNKINKMLIDHIKIHKNLNIQLIIHEKILSYYEKCYILDQIIYNSYNYSFVHIEDMENIHEHQHILLNNKKDDPILAYLIFQIKKIIHS